MNLRGIITALRTPNLPSQIRFMRDWQSFLRVHFLYSALESGLLESLRTPASREQLLEGLQVQRPGLLDAVLELGLSLGELSHGKGPYRIKGKPSRALLDSDGDALAAMIQEHVTYYNSVYRHLAARMQGAAPGDYLEEIAGLVARSSTLAEPFIESFLRATVSDKGPMTILEVGCGSDVYLRCAAEANAQATGVGIEMEEAVLVQAQHNLEKWDINDRFKVLVGDIRTPSAELSGPFDLITLYNVVYYFPVDDRPALFHSLRSMLSPGGALAIVSSVQGKGRDVWAANLDLAVRSTAGCAPLPELGEITDQLGDCGFDRITTTKLMPNVAFHGILASRCAQRIQG